MAVQVERLPVLKEDETEARGPLFLNPNNPEVEETSGPELDEARLRLMVVLECYQRAVDSPGGALKVSALGVNHPYLKPVIERLVSQYIEELTF